MSMIQSVGATDNVKGNEWFHNDLFDLNTISFPLESDEGKLVSEEEQKDLQSKFDMVKKMANAQTLQNKKLNSLLKQKGITKLVQA